jgi:anti-sigma regulatory factor (Ser/Thr protein kinase)
MADSRSPAGGRPRRAGARDDAGIQAATARVSAPGPAAHGAGTHVITGRWRGPGLRVLPADPRHARQIRDWIGAVVAAYPGPADPGDAALAADELFGNAAVHGPAGGLVLAAYCLWPGGVRLAVCDGGGPGAPRLRRGTAPDGAETGRGLQIVDAIAAQWGSFRLSSGGPRVVWCDLGAPLRVPAADAWAWLPPVLAACPLYPPAQRARAVPPGSLASAGAP